jgi:hypothetical protein
LPHSPEMIPGNKTKDNETTHLSLLPPTKWDWCSSTNNSCIFTRSDRFLWSSFPSVLVQIRSYHPQSTEWTQKHAHASGNKHLSSRKEKNGYFIPTHVIEYYVAYGPQTALLQWCEMKGNTRWQCKVSGLLLLELYWWKRMRGESKVTLLQACCIGLSRDTVL